MMTKRKLGKSEIEVTPIGLGAWQFSEGRGGATGQWAAITDENRDAIVTTALAGGINWFDTAELYGGGRSERGLAHALQKNEINNAEVVIATKWNPILRRANSITKTINNRKEALAPYQIDLHQIHFPVSFSSIASQMDALADLLDRGEIKTAGVSNFSAQQMRRAHEQLKKRGYFLASNQVSFSLLNRKIETNGILKLAKELGITVIAYSPLAMGLLTGKFHKDADLLKRIPLGRRMRLNPQIKKSTELINAIEEISNSYNLSISQVALNWLISYHGESVIAIPGASKPHHAQESAGAMGFQLSDDELRYIDSLSKQFL
jgi:aryl-alcohol dehydrogenase-like predicted oxidoreductase